MISSINKVLDEGNCVRVTEGGEEACERVDKPTIVFVVGRIHVKAARLRTGRHKGDSDTKGTGPYLRSHAAFHQTPEI